MKNPMVSIIIPVYNGSNYLREAIDSALAQTYDNFEIIVVNDGSNDNGETEQIALSYGDKIRYFKKENGGVATALNLAIKEMKGEYFSWLSHDDLYYPNKLSVQIEALKQRGDMKAIVYSEYDRLYMKDNSKEHITFSDKYPISKLENSLFPIFFAYPHGCTLLIHKSHFERVGLFNEKLICTQDSDMWFRMLKKQHLVFISQSLVCIREHNERGTYNISSYNIEQIEFNINKLKKLDIDDIIKLDIHPAILYFQVANLLMIKYNLQNLYEDLILEYKSLQLPEIIKNRENTFICWFNNLTENKKICIFCNGVYGKQLHIMLSLLNIKVYCFSDNNIKLWGTEFNSTKCISPDELIKIKDETFVIVATKNPESILNQLKELNFKNITTKQEIDKYFVSL